MNLKETRAGGIFPSGGVRPEEDGVRGCTVQRKEKQPLYTYVYHVNRAGRGFPLQLLTNRCWDYLRKPDGSSKGELM